MRNRWGNIIAGIACVMMVASPSLFAEASNTQATSSFLTDVALQPGNTLVGYASDEQGQAEPGARISLREAGVEIATLTADSHGRFETGHLRGGIYELAKGETVTAIRAWAPGTAPPMAKDSVLVSASVVRGQLPDMGGGFGGLGTITALGLGVTALTLSIVLPIALDGDDAS